MNDDRITEAELHVRLKYRNALVSKLAEFRSNDKFCDVGIIVDVKVFKCHRVVLSAASEYFDTMFNGKFKESSATEITLHKTQTNVFEEILKFIYTGDAVRSSSNIYNLIRAAEFYKFPLIIELCIEFIKKNLNAVVEDILKIFSFAHEVGVKQLVKFLSKHIYENFDYFYKTDEFSKLTFDGLMKVLNLIKTNRQPVVQDSFLDGICIWITHQVNLTSADRELYSQELLQRIDFTRISVQYTQSMTKRQMKEFVSSRSIDGGIDAPDASPRCTKLLRAYISTYYVPRSTMYQIGTSSIFTAYISSDISTASKKFAWAFTGELECCVEFMRNVVIDDRIYSLRCLLSAYPHQTFRSSSVVSMYPYYLPLKSPPCLLNDFDMCGTGNNIYVFNKVKHPLRISEDSGFSQEELNNGVYIYKRDVDKWFPLPSPKWREVLYNNVPCMTYDEGILYLTGGEDKSGTFQAYDPRTHEWSPLSSPRNYNGAACCAYEKKIYVVGGVYNKFSFEMYDTVSGKWQHLTALEEGRFSNHRLINWLPQGQSSHKILSFIKPSFIHSTILYNCASQNDCKWYPMPNLIDAVKNKYPPSTYTNFSTLDMVSF